VMLWPNGLLVSLVHFALAMVVGGVVLVVMHFKPLKASGYILPVLIGILSVAALVVLTGLVNIIRNGITAVRTVAPTPTILVMPSATPVVIRTSTKVPTTLPSATITLTPTLQPTPHYAIISASSGGGALLRTEPGSGSGSVITAISNGILVEVLPETQVILSSTWVRIRVNNMEGWVLQTVLIATTQVPAPTAAFTPTP
jgi:Bacterial SH3 domain